MILTNAPISEFMSVAISTIAPEDSVADAARRMKAAEIHHLPVLSGGALVGIVSALDLLRIPEDEREVSPVSVVMTTGVETVSPNASVRDILDLMRSVTFNAFPVVHGGKVVGIITSADLEELLYRDF